MESSRMYNLCLLHRLSASIPLPDYNNNHLQAVRLSSGELALLLNSPQIPPSFYQPDISSFDLSIPRVSAFNVVRGPVSPPLSPNSTSHNSEMTPKSSIKDLEKFPTPPSDKNDVHKENALKMAVQQSSHISSSTSFIKEEPSDKLLSDDEDFLMTKRAKVEAPPEPVGENVWRPW